MSEGRANYFWRVLATGLSFALFGVGGIILGALVFPLVALLSPGRERRVRRCRRLVQVSFRLFVGTMKNLGLLSYSIEGLECLQGEGKLVVANHPTLIDIVFLISRIPNACCIVRAGLFRNIFTRGPVSWAGYIANDGADELLDACERELRNGACLVVFPEGTRSVQGSDLHFKRGAAYIWMRANCDLVFATLKADPPTLAKHAPWYEIPERPFHYSIDLRDAQELALFSDTTASQPSAREVNRRWQDYFQRELAT